MSKDNENRFGEVEAELGKDTLAWQADSLRKELHDHLKSLQEYQSLAAEFFITASMPHREPSITFERDESIVKISHNGFWNDVKAEKSTHKKDSSESRIEKIELHLSESPRISYSCQVYREYEDPSDPITHKNTPAAIDKVTEFIKNL